jgi:hypothetical protein
MKPLGYSKYLPKVHGLYSCNACYERHLIYEEEEYTRAIPVHKRRRKKKKKKK